MGRRRIKDLRVAAVFGTAAALTFGFACANSTPEGPSEADSSAAAGVEDPGTHKEPEEPLAVDPAALYDPPTADVRPPKPPPGYNQSAPSFPNVTLWDQDGKEVEFYEDLVKGKIVVLSFFYATCDGT